MSHTWWEEKGIFWPDNENKKDLDHALGRIDAIDAALKHCRGFNRCIQAGGWVGAWPIRLAQRFRQVATYEPVPYLFDCMDANIARRGLANVVRSPLALGARPGALTLHVALSGCTSATAPVNAKEASRFIENLVVQQTTIDSEMETVQHCDALFLDVERFEIPVLEGALKTIMRFRPVITVEVLKGEGPKMLHWMERRAYKLVERCHNDWVFAP
jgi:FkbM family methyltransferase